MSKVYHIWCTYQVFADAFLVVDSLAAVVVVRWMLMAAILSPAVVSGPSLSAWSGELGGMSGV